MMDVSSALKVLRTATADTLRDHEQEIVSILADVRERLKAIPSSSHQTESGYSASVSDDSYRSSHDEVSQAESSVESHQGTPSLSRLSGSPEAGTSPKSCNTRDEPAKLLATSIGSLRWLYEFSKKKPIEVIDSKRSQGTDKRVEDIQRVEGRRRPGNIDKIFRGFAQRSMGRQLTRIQLTAQVKTRVDELCESICSSDPEMRARIQRRSGFNAKNLHHFRFDSEDREIVLRGINAGVKQLVVEKLLGKRLEEAGRPNRPIAISSITALNITAFNRLHFEDIPRFLDLLFLESSEVELPTNSFTTSSDSCGTSFFQIPDAIVNLSQWSMEFQDTYDKNADFAELPDLEQPQSDPIPTRGTFSDPAVHEMTSITSSSSCERPLKRRRPNVLTTLSSSVQLHPDQSIEMQHESLQSIPNCNDCTVHDNSMGLSNDNADEAVTSQELPCDSTELNNGLDAHTSRDNIPDQEETRVRRRTPNSVMDGPVGGLRAEHMEAPQLNILLQDHPISNNEQSTRENGSQRPIQSPLTESIHDNTLTGINNEALAALYESWQFNHPVDVEQVIIGPPTNVHPANRSQWTTTPLNISSQGHPISDETTALYALYESWRSDHPSDVERVITESPNISPQNHPTSNKTSELYALYESWQFDHPSDVERVITVPSSNIRPANCNQWSATPLNISSQPISEQWTTRDDEAVLQSWMEKQ